MNFATFVIFAIAAVCSVYAITCPTCTDPTDHTTCNETQDCLQDNNHDVCETRINRHDNHRIEYHCARAQNCADQENRNSCDKPATGGGGNCVICCNSVMDCETKTNAYFATVIIG